MKEACDNYDQVVAAVKARLAAGTATAADIDALHAAANVIKARYINRDSVFGAYTALLAQAQSAYNAAVDPKTVHNAEVKAAADALKALIDAGKDKTPYNIQANDIPNLQAAIDNLHNGLVNSIGTTSIANNNAALVNVYSPDGTRVRRNAKAATATTGLPKGIYIVGKKKVLVK